MKELTLEWDEGQRRILNWLGQVETELGELYESTLRMIKDPSFPGRERLICHAVREVRNRLPDAVAGKKAVERLHYTKEITLIAEAWEKAGLEGVYDKQSNGRSEEPEQRVPRDVLVRVDRLLRRHREVKDIKEENARRLMIALEPENEQLRASLAPVVGKWIEVTDWFVDRAHVGKAVGKDELVAHFEMFETVLGTFARYFYEGFEEIEKLVGKANASGGKPSDAEVGAVVLQLGRPKYRLYFFDKLENVYWIGPLKDNGFFQSPPEPKEGETYERWPEGLYLKKMAWKKAEEVLEIISKIKTRNPWVVNACVEILLEMPEDVAAKGTRVIQTLLPRNETPSGWAWIWSGRNVAQLMVRLAEKQKDAAFEIAWVLLDAWVPKEKKGFRDIVAKFTDHDYRELVLKEYRKLWELEPRRAFWVLVKMLNRCLKELDKENGYDVSSHFYAGLGLRDLDSIDVGYGGIETILVKGICEAGKVLIGKEPEELGELTGGLEGLCREIFFRVEMYLLRFVPDGTEGGRLKGIISNKKYLEEPGYKYEYKLLLRDKFDEICDEQKEAFIEWVKEEKVSEEQRKGITEWCTKNDQPIPDFEKMEYRAKAEELYLVRERFKELYEEYKAKSGATDEELEPKPMVRAGGRIDPSEGSPISMKEMLKMEPEEAVECLCDPTKWKMDKKKESVFHTPEEGLAGTFEKIVQQKVNDYAGLAAEESIKLKPIFLKRYFHGAWNALREKKIEEKSLVNFLDRANYVVAEKSGSEDYEGVFRSIIYVVEGIFENEPLRKKLAKENGKEIWGIIEPLAKYAYNPDAIVGSDRDPHTECINCVQGQAFTLVVRFGCILKNEDAGSYEKEWSKKVREVLTYVVEKVKLAKVRCVFGVWFPQLHWLEEKWVGDNLERIFDSGDDEKWDAVWGAYMSWGRVFKDVFELLAKSEKYGYAIDQLGKARKYKYSKDPEEGLVEHLMIGYFNGWIEFEENLLVGFLEKAPAKLRAYAARFLTTGFKSVNEEGGEEKKKVEKRMKGYWETRLAVIKEKKEENKDEAIELTGWVEDSVLPAKETLELLEKSLDLSGGKIGKMREARDFVEGVSKLGKGNELLALGCLKKAAADENMHMPWAAIQDPLVKFLEPMVESPENIQSEARDVVDLYGRYNPEKFRCLWEKLQGRQAN